MDAQIMAELQEEKYKKMLEEQYADMTPFQLSVQVTHMDPSELSDRLDVYHSHHPPVMVVTRKTTHVTAQFRLRGYLVRKELPPIYAATKLPTRASWASQFVTISGLGSDTFMDAIKVIVTIYQMLGRKVGQDSVQKFNTAHFMDHPCLNFSRTYFSTHSDGTSEPIPDNIDPFGRLSKLGQALHYNEDNRVGYMKLDVETGKRSDVDPSVFQVGSLVEVHFAFSAKYRKNIWKVYQDMYGLVLIDDTVPKWWQNQQLNKVLTPPPTPFLTRSKRCLCLDEEDEDISGARKKLKELDIGSEVDHEHEDMECQDAD